MLLDTSHSPANFLLRHHLQLASVQEQEHERQVQVEHAQLALPHLHADSVSDGPMQPGMLQTPRKKRRLHTSQKRLIKVTQPDGLTDILLPALLTW